MPATTFALRPVGCLAGLGSGPHARPLLGNTYAEGVGNGCWPESFYARNRQELAASLRYDFWRRRRNDKSPNAIRLSVEGSGTALVTA